MSKPLHSNNFPALTKRGPSRRGAVGHTGRSRDDSRVTPGFGDCARGNPSPTPSSASAEPSVDVPLEVAPADWQDHLETVELDPEFDEIER